MAKHSITTSPPSPPPAPSSTITTTTTSASATTMNNNDQSQSSCSYRFICSSLTQLPATRDYDIIIRQQPERSKMSVINERDRRPIEPPPILQMKWLNCSPEDTKKCLQSPFYFLVANLVDAENNDQLLLPAHEYLSGTTVSSLHRLRDIDNKDGGFYVFGDLSVKKNGIFKLQFSLFEIVEDRVQNRRTLLSAPFTVYLPKHFPGPMEATFLSRTFSDQGVKMRIRKEHRLQAATAKKRKTDRRPFSVADINEHDRDTKSIERASKRKLTPPSYAPLSQEVHFGRFLSASARKSSTAVAASEPHSSTVLPSSPSLKDCAMDIDQQHYHPIYHPHDQHVQHNVTDLTPSSIDYKYQAYQYRDPQVVYPSPQSSTDLSRASAVPSSSSSSSSSSTAMQSIHPYSHPPSYSSVWTHLPTSSSSSSSSSLSSSSSSTHVTTPPSPTYTQHFSSSPPTYSLKLNHHRQHHHHSLTSMSSSNAPVDPALSVYHLSSPPASQLKQGLQPPTPPPSLLSHPTDTSSSPSSSSSSTSSSSSASSPPSSFERVYDHPPPPPPTPSNHIWGSKLPPLRAIMTDSPMASIDSPSADEYHKDRHVNSVRSYWQLPPLQYQPLSTSSTLLTTYHSS